MSVARPINEILILILCVFHGIGDLKLKLVVFSEPQYSWKMFWINRYKIFTFIAWTIWNQLSSAESCRRNTDTKSEMPKLRFILRNISYTRYIEILRYFHNINNENPDVLKFLFALLHLVVDVCGTWNISRATKHPKKITFSWFTSF